MKKFTAALAMSWMGLIAFASFGISSSAMAMGRGVLRGSVSVTDSAQPVKLIDKNNQSWDLSSGEYDLRLSVKNSNMTFKKAGGGSAIELSVPQFRARGASLRNFKLVGSEFGQSYDFVGSTQDRVIGQVESEIRWVACVTYDVPGCYLRACSGAQAVRHVYNQVERVFALALLDPASGASVAQYQGVVEQREDWADDKLVGGCVIFPYNRTPSWP